MRWSVDYRRAMNQTVFVDFTNKARPREIARDARDPLGDVAPLERLAEAYSRRGKTVRMYADGLYITPWRKRKHDPLYEARDGVAAEGWT